MLVLRSGSYPSGQETRFSITANYETADGSTVAGAAAELACWVGGEPTPEPETPTPIPNQAPTVSAAIGDGVIVDESGTHQVSLAGVFDAADDDALTITATSSNEAAATVSVAADYASLTVNAQARGTATITATAADGNGGTVEDAFMVTVKAAPVVASAIADVGGLAVGATQDLSLSGVFSDADGDALTITAASSDDARATATVAADQSKLTVAGVAEGTATVTVTAEDTDGNQVSDSFSVSVVPAPERQEQATLPGPVANLLAEATEDTITVTWQAPESGSAPTRYIAHIKPEGGGKGATKRPQASKTSVTFKDLEAGATYKVWVRAQNEAGKGERVHATITLPEAEPEQGDEQQQQQQGTPNNAPTVSAAMADAVIVNQSGTLEVSLSGVFSDADNDALAITASSSDEAVATVSVASDHTSLTATAKSRGTATITATANDGNGGTVSDAFTVTVKAAPQVASAISDVSGLEAGSTRDVSLSGVFTDADGDSLTVTAGSDDDDVATVSVAADYTKLTVAGVAAGEATITVTAQDSDGNRALTDFDVSVNAPQQQDQNPQPQMQTPGPGDTVWSATLIVGKGLSDTSFTYKGETYEVISIFIHEGRFYIFNRPVTMQFRRAQPYTDPNLPELALRIGNSAFLSITDSPPYRARDATWKNPGLSWNDGDEVSVSLEVLTPAPTGVTITPGDEKLDLSWTAPAVPAGTTITGYEVRRSYTYRYQALEWYNPIPTGNTNAEYSLTGLTNRRDYIVQVRATHSRGHGAWASPPGRPLFYAFVGTPAGPPDAPTGVRPQPGDGRLLVNWTMDPQRNGGAPVTGYHVHYTASTTVAADAAAGSDPAIEWVDAGDAGTDTSHWISGLTNDTAYRVRVHAVNQHGDGDWSAVASGTPTHPAPLLSVQAAYFTRDGKPGIKLTYRLDPQARPVDVVAQVIDPVKHRRTVWDERAPGGSEVVWPERSVSNLLPQGASITCADDPDSPGVGHCEVTGLPAPSHGGPHHARLYTKAGEVLSVTSVYAPKWYGAYSACLCPATFPAHGIMHNGD